MLSLDTNVVMLLSDNFVKTVFGEVLKNRTVLFKDLHESLKSFSEQNKLTEVDKSQLNSAVEKLKEANLIKERGDSIEDFKTYYVTAAGLNTERQLRLADPTFASSQL